MSQTSDVDKPIDFGELTGARLEGNIINHGRDALLWMMVVGVKSLDPHADDDHNERRDEYISRIARLSDEEVGVACVRMLCVWSGLMKSLTSEGVGLLHHLNRVVEGYRDAVNHAADSLSSASGLVFGERMNGSPAFAPHEVDAADVARQVAIFEQTAGAVFGGDAKPEAVN